MATELHYMILDDLPRVVEIERACFKYPWKKKDFRICLRRGSGTIVKLDDEIVGFVVYHLLDDQIVLLNLAVHPKFQGFGHGRRLVQSLIDKLGRSRRKITLQISERNLNGQLFFQHFQFRAIRVCRHFFTLDDGETEDSYELEFQKYLDPYSPVNRIAGYLKAT